MKRRNPAERPAYDAVSARESNALGRRIEEARRQTGMSQSELSQQLSAYGIHVNFKGISKWEKGTTVPNAHQLIALCYALEIHDVLDSFGRPELNREGLRKLGEYRLDLIASGRYAPSEPEGELVYIDMPVSRLPAAAGYGEFLDDDDVDMVRFPKSSVPEGAQRGIRVSGDSMEPVYHDGQIVWIQFCDTLRPNEEGIFLYGSRGYLKVYSEQLPEGETAEMLTDAEGRVRPQPVLRSYNPRYDPIPVSPEEYFKIVGRVL